VNEETILVEDGTISIENKGKKFGGAAPKILKS